MKANCVRICCFTIILAVVFGLLTGCSTKETYDNYSYGITENGFYENIDKYDCEMPDLYSLSFTCDEVLAWGLKQMQETGNTDINTVDDYVRRYGEELLAYLDLTNKEVAEEGDIASISLEFSIDGEKLADYSSTNNYEVSADGDAILSSIIGHKTKDVYDVEYVFPDDDADYPSKTAIVTVTINSIVMSDPIENGVVEANLDAIGELLDGVVDVETYLIAIRPELAKSTLESFVENYMQNIEFDVPDEYVEYEMYRLKSRLYQIGFTYDAYLETTKMTNDEVRKYCAMVAQENYMAMKVFASMNYELDDEKINTYYGNNREYVESVQGLPYMKLNMIRDIALYEIVENTVITDADGNVIFGKVQTDDVENDNADNVVVHNEEKQGAADETSSDNAQ